MTLLELVKEKKMNAYQLSKMTGIPYMTINDLLNFKTHPRNMTLDNALKLAAALDVKVEVLAKLDDAPLTEFNIFRSDLINEIRKTDPFKFISKIMKNKEIDFYYKNGGKLHALFLLATIDYLSRIYHYPLSSKRYNEYRKVKLDRPIFTSSSIISFSTFIEAERTLGIRIADEFKRHNIIEVELTNIRL